MACSAILRSFVDTVCELEVSPIFPSDETLCPASPSLQRVPWTSVPRLPNLSGYRYCARLRLPHARPKSLCLSLDSRYHTRSLFSFVCARKPTLTPGAFVLPVALFPSGAQYGDMRPSQVTELSLCMHALLSDPGGVLPLAFSQTGLLPSAPSKASAFLPVS